MQFSKSYAGVAACLFFMLYPSRAYFMQQSHEDEPTVYGLDSSSDSGERMSDRRQYMRNQFRSYFERRRTLQQQQDKAELLWADLERMLVLDNEFLVIFESIIQGKSKLKKGTHVHTTRYPDVFRDYYFFKAQSDLSDELLEGSRILINPTRLELENYGAGVADAIFEKESQEGSQEEFEENSEEDLEEDLGDIPPSGTLDPALTRQPGAEDVHTQEEEQSMMSRPKKRKRSEEPSQEDQAAVRSFHRGRTRQRQNAFDGSKIHANPSALSTRAFTAKTIESDCFSSEEETV